MAWMVPSATAWRLRTLPVTPAIGFLGISAITLAFAWGARHDTTRGALVLTISLLLAAWFLMTVQ
jgi:hypothetical protein